MKTMLGQMLFGQISLPEVPGRTVRFDREELDIGLATGPMEERVAGVLKLAGYPMTASEITHVLQSNASQVTRGLRKLIAEDRVEIIDVEGCPREYALQTHKRASLNLGA